MQDALGAISQLQSNSTGELTSAAAAGGSVDSYAYASSGNLTSYTDPLGGTITSSYAANSPNLTTFTDQRGNQTHYTYDAAGNVIGITYQDGSGAAYTYDAKGLLTTSTDAIGNITRYGYDGSGDLTSKLFADGTSDIYAYDSRGNLTTATLSTTGTNTYTYDAANRLTSETNPAGQIVSYTYNAQGELASRTLPDGSVTRDSYDAFGRLSQLQDGSGKLLVRYTYNAAGELARTDTGNGASTTYQYDADGNVTEILDSNADGTVADRIDYTYNAKGQVIEDATSEGVWTYGYDKSGQLTSAVFQSVSPVIANQTLTYAYDAAGNRVSQAANGTATAYTTNALNQYTAAGGITYIYDADGNTTSKTDSNGTTAFSYNDSGKLVSQIGPDGSYQYVYDALGNLVSTTQNGVVSYYVNDPLSLVTASQPLTSLAQVYSETGTLEATYDFGLGLAASTNAEGNVGFFEFDAAGNVTGVTAPNGSLSNTYSYLPFGQLLYTTGNLDNVFTAEGAFGIASFGTVYLDRNRFYDPELGRFLSPDLSGLNNGANLYEYALNNPLNFSDITGQEPKSNKELSPDQRRDNIEKVLMYEETYGTNATVYEFNTTPLPFQTHTLDNLTLKNFNGQYIGSDIGPVDLDWTITLAAYGMATGIPPAELYVPGKAVWSVMDHQNHLTTILSQSKLNAVLLSSLIHYGVSLSTAFSLIHLHVVGASVSGDPHLKTFDGLRYNFQTAGEFVLTRQLSDGNFAVQARISAPFNKTTYSVVTELAIQVGADRVTIDSTRANVVWVNGVAATFTNGVDMLAGGQITQTHSQYVVTLNTGESVTASIRSFGVQVGPGTSSQGIDVAIALNPIVEQPGTIEGLLGNANGDPTKDLTLADGTVLPTNMQKSELYGAYADSWRVTQASSLLDYGPNQTTDTFTDRNYPGQAITLASFPTAQVAAAEALAAQAGITDAGLKQDAAFDYLATGDSSFLVYEANQQQQGSTTAAIADISTPATGSSVGVIAAAPTQVEAGSGATTADFQVYRSGDTSGALTVAYAVVAADTSFVGASAFGGTLPSGTISFAAGQATADLSITLPAGIGTLASQSLQVQITAPASTQVIGPTAQVQILNSAPVAGPAPSFAVELLDDETVIPTVSGNTWTFDLAGPTQGAASSTGTLTLAVLNAASLGADSLSGTITAAGDGSLPATVTQRFDNLAPSALADIAVLNLAAASLAGGTETFTIALTEKNATGYSQALPTETVIVQNPSTLIGPPVLTAPTSATVTAGAATAITGVSLAETGSLTGETFTVTLTDTNGLLSATGTGVQGSGSTALTITGSLSDVNADLATLQDTDATTPSDTVTLNATDSLGNSATPAQIAIAVQTIGGTSPTQPGQPVITAPASATVTAGMATAISGVSLAEVGSLTGETFTVTLTDTKGLLSATGTGVQGSGSTALTVTGSLSDVNADLATLQDTYATTPSDTITLNATDNLGNSATPAQIAIAVQTIGGISPTQPGKPAITAPASATVTAGTATAISGVSIDESGNIAGELFTVTLINTNGLLSATGTGVQGFGSMGLTITGSLSEVNADLATLQDTDASTAPDTITLNATDSLGSSAAQTQIAITVQTSTPTSPTQPGQPVSPPAVTAPASATVTAGTATAISGVSLAETGSLTGETFTMTLTDTNGLLSATGTGVQGVGSTGLTITGSLSDVNADLATLQDTDASTDSDTITLNATDSLGNSAAPAQIAITVQTIGGTSSTQPGGTTTGSGNSPGNSTPVASAPVYRFFDSHTGTQFLTSSASERDNVLETRPDLISEGVGLQAVVPAAGDTTATPIYRFFDTIYGTHFYTSNGPERDTIVATRPDLTYEGIGFYEYATQQPNSAAVYRFFESTNGTHFYTSSADERANILATRTDLIPEGIAFYAPVST